METIVQEYLTLKLPDHRQSRAKALAVKYEMKPLDVRKAVVKSGHSLIGCDVQAYNKQTMTDAEKRQWQDQVIEPARTEFWDTISEEDLERRRTFFAKQMTETTARLKSDPKAYKIWRDSQKEALRVLYDTTDLRSRISKTVTEHFRENGPNPHKSNFEHREIIGGKEIIFDSGWEASCYKLLRKLEVNFTYAGKRGRKNWIPFTKGTKSGWNPDFVLIDHNAIIETKGHYPAVWDKWISHDLPNILLEGLPYDIYLMDFDPRKIKSTTLEGVFAECELVSK